MFVSSKKWVLSQLYESSSKFRGQVHLLSTNPGVDPRYFAGWNYNFELQDMPPNWVGATTINYKCIKTNIIVSQTICRGGGGGGGAHACPFCPPPLPDLAMQIVHKSVDAFKLLVPY